MNATIMASELRGTVGAIPSKSHLHRLLICAALANKSYRFGCHMLSKDIRATMRCLNSLGAKVTHLCNLHRVDDVQKGRYVSEGSFLEVAPLRHVPNMAELDPGESGSTYRFFAPISLALGVVTRFTLHGKLPNRPMKDLWRAMERRGALIAGDGTEHPVLSGRLTPGEYRLPGDVSSQFFTGLLFALPLLDGDSVIVYEGKLESVGYIEMTLDALEKYSIKVERNDGFFFVPGRQKYTVPETYIDPEGDWSNSAFWLCAGAAKGEVAVTGLNLSSKQGDRAVVDILKRFGADVARVNSDTVKTSAWKRDGATISACARKGITVDVSDIPDLVPALAVAAMAAKGRTVFENAGRLRLKESDRIASVCAAVNALGGKAFAEGDSLIIEGGERPKGGTVDACGDHRIAMLAAAAAPWCTGMVKIIGAEAVDKSYPGFWHDFASLGGEVWLEEV